MGWTDTLVAAVSKEENDAWVSSLTPIQGEFRAFMVGIAIGTMFVHEVRYGLAWERLHIIYRLQKIKNRVFATFMWALGQFCSADFLVPYFALLYWVLDQDKCVYGIWLVPLSEVSNGMLKWWFGVPRPGWVDSKVKLKAWSNELSFPSSHAQIVWALATFFSGQSTGYLRGKLYGSYGHTLVAYWYFLLMPFVFASCVCLARVYEGVHYPRDILVGAGMGVALASLYLRLLPSLAWVVADTSPLCQIAALAVCSLLWLAALHMAYVRARRRLDRAAVASWTKTAARGKHTGKVLAPVETPYTSYVSMCGVMVGLSVCVPLVPSTPLPLPPSLLSWSTVGRSTLGPVVLLAVYYGIRVVEKTQCKTHVGLARLLRFCRYASVPAVILLAAPALFLHLGI